MNRTKSYRYMWIFCIFIGIICSEKIMKRSNAAERYYKKNLIVFSVVFIPLILIFVALAFAFNDVPRATIFPIVLTLTFIPFLIYYLVKYIHYKNVVFDKVKRGKVVDCETFNRGRYGTFVGFYVVFNDEYGEERKVLTKHCHNRADGYLGCQVDVGYDASTGEWIVLE